MNLKEWSAAFGETGASENDPLYRSQPAHVVTAADKTGFKTTGEWKDDAPAKPEEAQNYYNGKLAKQADGGSGTSATATFTPNLATPGLYRVEVRWPAVWLNARNVPITVKHAGGSETQRWDQTQFDRQGWRPLGTFRFAAGRAGAVTIGTEGILPGNEVHSWTKTVRADAVRWVKVPGDQTSAAPVQ